MKDRSLPQPTPPGPYSPTHQPGFETCRIDRLSLTETPTRVSSTHLAFISTTQYPACLATTCASVVLPSPGGPHSSATYSQSGGQTADPLTVRELLASSQGLERLITVPILQPANENKHPEFRVGENPAQEASAQHPVLTLSKPLGEWIQLGIHNTST